MSDDPSKCPTDLADCSARNNAKQVHVLPALYPYAVPQILYLRILSQGTFY